VEFKPPQVDAVAASTSMEGIPVTVEEVRQISRGTRPTSVSESDAELVRVYRDGMALANAFSKPHRRKASFNVLSKFASRQPAAHTIQLNLPRGYTLPSLASISRPQPATIWQPVCRSAYCKRRAAGEAGTTLRAKSLCPKSGGPLALT
jgi:hypothetical protein